MTSTPTSEPGEPVTTSDPEFRAVADALAAIYPEEITVEWIASQPPLVAAAMLLVTRIEDPPAPSTPGEGTGEQRCVHCGQTPDDPGASMCQIDGISTGKLHDFQPGEGTGRPGGWVEGIGWVALFHDLPEGTRFLSHSASEPPITSIVGVMCSPDDWENYPVIVTRWADGTTPAPPASPVPPTPTPCPYIVSGDEGTSYCSLAETCPAPSAPSVDREAIRSLVWEWSNRAARERNRMLMGSLDAADTYEMCADELADLLAAADRSGR